jgi:hypothetical protein
VCNERLLARVCIGVERGALSTRVWLASYHADPWKRSAVFRNMSIGHRNLCQRELSEVPPDWLLETA